MKHKKFNTGDLIVIQDFHPSMNGQFGIILGHTNNRYSIIHYNVFLQNTLEYFPLLESEIEYAI